MSNASRCGMHLRSKCDGALQTDQQHSEPASRWVCVVSIRMRIPTLLRARALEAGGALFQTNGHSSVNRTASSTISTLRYFPYCRALVDVRLIGGNHTYPASLDHG